MSLHFLVLLISARSGRKETIVGHQVVFWSILLTALTIHAGPSGLYYYVTYCRCYPLRALLYGSLRFLGIEPCRIKEVKMFIYK